MEVISSVRIGEQPQQSAIDQGDVSEVATLTINSGQELKSTPEKTNASDVFNPEIVKPSPKTPPRLQTATKRRIRKTAVLTDTPEKNGLAEEHAKKKAKKNGDLTNKGKKYNNNKENANAKRKEKAQEKAKRRVLQERDSDSNEDLEWNCIVCCDSYSNSLPREQWIECIICKNWAHVKCINDAGITYVYLSCESDEELNDEYE
ncbi:hypothetical protein WA026_012847 [Henosepilachna vigintioctopunctata]|uniref:Zinc finger PHD-type domain-containing protein n=1 Tax=Henosepilachna vigintioctopunctata TaxID=420089 RepID=A0AAW1TSR9_9CUCU